MASPAVCDSSASRALRSARREVVVIGHKQVPNMVYYSDAGFYLGIPDAGNGNPSELDQLASAVSPVSRAPSSSDCTALNRPSRLHGVLRPQALTEARVKAEDLIDGVYYGVLNAYCRRQEARWARDEAECRAAFDKMREDDWRLAASYELMLIEQEAKAAERARLEAEEAAAWWEAQ
jgi:hypothetical protein